MLKIAPLFGACLTIGTAAIADPLTLKCNVTTDGKQSEVWLVVDQASNTMTVGGGRQELEMTNKYYRSVARRCPARC
jgi:hypothetical protein